MMLRIGLKLRPEPGTTSDAYADPARPARPIQEVLGTDGDRILDALRRDAASAWLWQVPAPEGRGEEDQAGEHQHVRGREAYAPQHDRPRRDDGDVGA